MDFSISCQELCIQIYKYVCSCITFHTRAMHLLYGIGAGAIAFMVAIHTK